MPAPPFRADHVGSFLRPRRLREARERHQVGALDAAGLREVEDACIREVVQHQEDVGLEGVTDGEFRRTYFHVDFLEELDGVSVTYGEFKAAFRKDDGTEVGFAPPTMHVEGRIGHSRNIQGADFDFLSRATRATPKVCIPAPSMLHFRGGRDAISREAYPELEPFYEDLAAAYRAEITDLAARGCRYLQLDDTNLAYLCDPAIRERTAARGDDPDALARLYCRLVNDAVRDAPADMTLAVHLCRGNFKSAWVAQGGYEPVAAILFNEMNVDAFFLEYDDERSGDFAPLRHLPAPKTAVLGLMSSKRAEPEPHDVIRRRIDEAARYVPLERCCLSHQCGFSSTAHGNELAEDDQWVKLTRCVEIADAVWG
jgi:5-methyltetrahydropteroyltriglutamate--homocysteine methyltransferase